MIVAWAAKGREDYLYWQAMDRQVLKRINALIKDIQRSPHEGLGNAEPLRHNWSGYWSRRIDREHRLVYKATGEMIIIVQCRYHY